MDSIILEGAYFDKSVLSMKDLNDRARLTTPLSSSLNNVVKLLRNKYDRPRKLRSHVPEALKLSVFISSAIMRACS